jgi:hypothetical protein
VNHETIFRPSWAGQLREDNAIGRYPNISDHGLIGQLQTAALVSTDGVVN